MKNLIILFLILLTFGCKKESSTTIENLYDYTWPLATATISPAKVIDGKSVTDIKTAYGPNACLNNNYTLVFKSNGSFAFTSTGPLCDMISFDKATYTRNGNEITLNMGYGANLDQKATLKGNTIVQLYTFTENGVNYTITYTFIPKSIK
ncbi:hypothetical protein [Pedobacter sp. MW01-1-1]|uniref:hypothetical protein n=1 Tax=Pedobacter sp. MW01-1-1 TaxID=3383027 RepID=UPI003FF023D9